MIGLLRRALCSLFRLLYKVEISGLEHFDQAGDRVLVVANHTSFIDAVLLALYLPQKLTFAINTQMAQRWWIRPFLLLVQCFPMDPANPLATKSLIRYLQKDNKAVIFPEGRITVTGSLMKIYDGTGLVADKSGAMILPVRIDGAQYTPFSRLRGRVRIRWFPKITLTVLSPVRLEPGSEFRGRARRREAGRMLSDLMTEMMFATSDYRKTLFQGLLDARQIHGGRHVILEDVQRKALNYDRVVTGAYALGRAFAGHTREGEYVAVLLPNMTGTVIAFMGLQAFGRVPAMLNYTVGAHGMLSACKTAQINTVITSRRFIEMAKLQDVATQLQTTTTLLYLEDLVAEITVFAKLLAWLSMRFADLSYYRYAGKVDPDSPAVVLFTSGSEGAPKGVVLSHTNLMANRQQLAARVDFTAQDRVLNALPIFHSFGLTGGTLLPLISGVYTFFYPSPLHYRIVPEMAYDINATILFGTNTFLSGYARFAHPYDFYSVRYVFAGAEKLQEQTRRTWSDRYGVRIFEGYGATETSPALTTNTPMANQPGSVGRFLPGIKYRLEPVPGVEEGGRLHVQGPNIMLGYLLADNPAVLVPPQLEDGVPSYDTGDIVKLDEGGFVYIQGRAKRFAKVGGEMVSLTAVEELACRLWPDELHAVVALPDAHKGEQLVLVTEKQQAHRSELLKFARDEGIGEINVPRKLLVVKKLPVLGTGKIDYKALETLATEGQQV